MGFSKVVRRTVLFGGVLMLLAAAQCVVVAPPPGGGGGEEIVTPPPPPEGPVYANARFVRSARCEGRISRWRTRGFYDIGLRQCYACPRVYRRSIFHVRSRQACVRGIALFAAAQYLGRPGCRGAQFQFRGNCYRCPRGYRWTRRGLRCIGRR